MDEGSELFIQEAKLRSAFRDWIPKRKATVRTLRVFADELMEHHNKVCIAQVAGSSFSIAGFATLATGFGLSFVTFGASLVLCGVGLVMGAAGGLTNVGSSMAEAFIQKKTFDTVQKIIEEDREATEAIQKLLEQSEQTIKQRLNQWLKKLKMGSRGANILKTCAETGYKIGVRVGAASKGGEALFKSLSVAGRVAHVGGFVFNAALLPLDIYTLVTNSMEIDASRKGNKDKETEVVKQLRKITDDLERELLNDEDDFA
ncbi:uncharacterized protein LOC144631638 [Oculina patagonica]